MPEPLPHFARNCPYFLRTPMIKFIPHFYGGDWLPHLVVCRRVQDMMNAHTVTVYVTWSPLYGLRRYAMS